MFDPLDQLRKLGDLRSQGIISDEEFRAKKDVLLAQVGSNGNARNSTTTGSPVSIPANSPDAPPSLPTISVPQVDAAFAEMETLAREVADLQTAVDKLHQDQMSAQSKHRLVASILQLRKLGDLFPLGRYGTLIVTTAAIGGLGAIIGIGIRLSVFATTWLTLLCALSGAVGCAVIIFWRSDAALMQRHSEIAKVISNVSLSLSNARPQLTDRESEWNAAKARHQALLAALQSRRNRLLSSDWRCMRGIPFEEFLCEIFRELGFECEMTRASGDQGVDLIAKIGELRIAIQAKGYAESVGNKAVQEAHAGMTFHRCNQAMVITNSSFTASAIELAGRLNCRLIDGSQIPHFICGKLI